MTILRTERNHKHHEPLRTTKQPVSFSLFLCLFRAEGRTRLLVCVCVCVKTLVLKTKNPETKGKK